MELVVFIDFASAQARLALEPTRQLARETGVALDWRPFPRKPRRRGGIDPRSKGARHAQVRAAYRLSEEAFYAEQQGIALVYPDSERECSAANAGLAWLRRQQGPLSAQVDAYVNLVFEQVWRGAMDPCDRAAARHAVAAADGDTTGFDSWLGELAEADLEHYRRQALEQGAVDVPGYVVHGEPFVGRANLPAIRWLLTGHGNPARV